MPEITKVRIDKWLWAVRVFKTRTLATDHCKSGKVKLNNEIAKPSKLVIVGDSILCKKNGFEFTFKVTGLLEKRVNASTAQLCYEDLTSLEELNKYKDWFVTKQAEFREKGAGRPTKKERREIDDFKENRYDWFDETDIL
jgi:ribosome-associated heat shock protein Hsp15